MAQSNRDFMLPLTKKPSHLPVCSHVQECCKGRMLGLKHQRFQVVYRNNGKNDSFENKFTHASGTTTKKSINIISLSIVQTLLQLNSYYIPA